MMVTTKTRIWGLFGLVALTTIVAAVCIETEQERPGLPDQAARRQATITRAQERGLQVHHREELVVITDAAVLPTALDEALVVVRELSALLELQAERHEGVILIVADPWAMLELRIAMGARGSLDTKEHAQASYNAQADLITIAELPDSDDPRALARLLAHELTHRALRLAGHERIRRRGAWIEEGLAGLAELLIAPPDAEPKARVLARALALADACEPLAGFMAATEEGLESLLPVHLSYHFQGRLENALVHPGRIQATALAQYLYRSAPRSLICALRHQPESDEEGLSSLVDEQEFLTWLKEENRE